MNATESSLPDWATKGSKVYLVTPYTYSRFGGVHQTMTQATVVRTTKTLVIVEWGGELNRRSERFRISPYGSNESLRRVGDKSYDRWELHPEHVGLKHNNRVEEMTRVQDAFGKAKSSADKVFRSSASFRHIEIKAVQDLIASLHDYLNTRNEVDHHA